MKEVSLFDHLIVAIREGRFDKSEVSEVIRELYAAYPEVFEQVGLDGAMQADWKDYDETLPDRDVTGQRPY
jgi:mRNA-degrading endonuclease YafQ of YafQ-DinJ toxin-antitoxin module